MAYKNIKSIGDELIIQEIVYGYLTFSFEPVIVLIRLAISISNFR